MAPRPLTKLKDAVVLAYLRGLLDSDSGVVVRPTCSEIKGAINEDDRALLWHEEVYNALLRLEAAGDVKRTAINSRVIGWEATRPDSLLVREPVRTIRQS